MTKDENNPNQPTPDGSRSSSDEAIDSEGESMEREEEAVRSSDDTDEEVPQKGDGGVDVPTNQVTPNKGLPNSQKSYNQQNLNQSVPDATWIYQYYNAFAGVCLSSEKRRVVIKTLIDADYVSFSTKALKGEVKDRLINKGLLNSQKSYNQQNLNQFLSEFEALGPLYRIPKFEGNGKLGQDQEQVEHVLLPMTSMLRWLNQANLDTDYITDEQKPTGWKTHYIGQYITDKLDDELSNKSELEAGNILPVKAVLQAVVREYCSVTENELSVDLEIGSLSEVRNGCLELKDLLSHLSVEDAVPEPDGPFVGDDGVHDYAIFGRVSGVTSVDSRRDLQRGLTRQLIYWLTSAQEFYERDMDENKDISDPLEQSERQQAVSAFQQREPLTRARERFDQDVAVIEESGDDSEGEYTIICGLYRRSGDNSPNDP